MSERPSPLQNRVTPFGEIIATPERGMFLGNRGGQIHNAKKELTSRRWVSAQWITCLLEFKGRHMEVRLGARAVRAHLGAAPRDGVEDGSLA
jgi:hypothetical protein